MRKLILVIMVLSGLAITSSAAAVAIREPGRFDLFLQARTGGMIPAAPRLTSDLDPGDGLRAGWEQFSRRNGGSWKVYVDERTGMPSLAFGRGVQWFADAAFGQAGQADLAQAARRFLDGNRDLLGNWDDLLVLDEAATVRWRGGVWQLAFRQEIDGVPVEGARLLFHLAQGRLTMFGAADWARPALSAEPGISMDDARAVLNDYLQTDTGQYLEPEPPALVILPVNADPDMEGEFGWSGPRGAGLSHVLAWRLQFQVPGEAPVWVAEVNAHDGSILSFYDGAQYDAVRGGVFPISMDGDCSTGGCEFPDFPMPYADFTETAQPEGFADEFANLVCVDSGETFETHLSGPYVNIVDGCGSISRSGSCTDGADLGMKQGENCDSGIGITSAARTTYYHLNRAFENARFYDPGNTWLNSPLTVNVNSSAGTCNAFWTGTQITMYQGGGGCSNTGEGRGVLVHEWGHGYDHNDGGGTDLPGEGYSDVVAIFANRSSCMSRGWYNDGRVCGGYGDTCLTCTGIRDLDWAKRQNNTPITAPAFVMNNCEGGGQGWSPCGQEPHCEGMMVGEILYDLATRDLPAAGLDQDSAWQLAERLWYETRPGSGGNAYSCLRGNANSCGSGTWFQKMRVADDDDGDLTNGTPHAAALFAAFGRHALACGSAGNAEHQSTGSCPALAAPSLNVVEGAGGTELSWSAVTGAAEYRIYRGELGCDRQQIPIAVVAGTAYTDATSDQGFPRFYRVEPFGSNPACNGPVSNCEGTPTSGYLRYLAHRFVEDGSNDNNIPDPGETVQMPVSLFNRGIGTVTGIQGTLRMVNPSQGVISDPGATWVGIPYAGFEESDAPWFELTVDETVPCGSVLALEMDYVATNAAAGTIAIDVPMGDPHRDFLQDQNETVPADPGSVATSTIVIDQDHPILELDVSVSVQHSFEQELIVELTSPQGTTVRLHNQTDIPLVSGVAARYDLERSPDGPGTMTDFIGETTLGTWTLRVEDTGSLSSGNGYLYDWTLHIDVDSGFDCHPFGCAEPIPGNPVTGLLVDKVANGAALDLVFDWDNLAVAGYHLLQSSTPDFAVETDAGQTAGTTLTLPDGANTTPDLTFFLVRGANSCDQQGP